MEQLCSTLPPPNIITYSIHEPGSHPPGSSFLPAAEINASRNKVKPLTYHLPQNPLDKYDSGVMTQPNVDTGTGGSSSDFPWNYNDKDIFHLKESKWRIYLLNQSIMADSVARPPSPIDRIMPQARKTAPPLTAFSLINCENHIYTCALTFFIVNL